MNRIIHSILLLVITGISCFSLKGQQIPLKKIESKIDRIIDTTFTEKGPGTVFLVSQGDQIIYRKARGMANVEWEIPLLPESVFQIGSMTKQFTAIAILMLHEQGRLNINDDITRYLPDYPTHGNKITLHHLLNHTSGIKDFTKMKNIMEISRTDLSPSELIDFFKDEPMDFIVGEKFQYSNSGYIILGYIIEKITGLPYAEYIEKNIFRKAQMERSSYASDRKIINKRAYGYHGGENLTNKMFISLSLPYASGSLMSNVDDLSKWQSALNNEVLLQEKTLKMAFTNYKLNDGSPTNYGYGWHLRSINNIATREHGGSIFGYKSMAVYVPSKDLYVVGLSNCDCNSPTQITRTIVTEILSELP